MSLRRKVHDDLRRWKDREDRRPLLINGARGVGKTHAIKEFAYGSYGTVVYIDFETDGWAHAVFDGDITINTIIMNVSARFPDTPIVPYDTVIILDEIQECPRARAALKPFSEDPRYDIIASSSLPGIDLGRIPSIPVGHQERISMHPLDFEEFLWALGIKDEVMGHIRACIRDRKPLEDSMHRTLMTYVSWYILVGGMPEAVERFVSNRTFDGVRKAQSDIISGYRDDVSEHCDDVLEERIELCFKSLTKQLSKNNKRFVAAGIEPDLGYRPSVARYASAVSWLCQAGVVHGSRRVSVP